MCTQLPFNLTGKTALVTGATGGIGDAIARQLHAMGATIIASGRRQEALDKLTSELGERAFSVTADISNQEQVASLLDDAEKASGQPIDILICNAGITRDNLALRMKDDDWDDVLQTNLTSAFKLNKAAFKKMMKRRWGRIINIASVVGVTGNPGQANYVASKAGLIGMSKALAQESAPRGITINCVAPGFIKTAMTDALNDNQREAITASIPSGKLGTPDDIASAVAFLASEQASYITGQTIHVNGGMVMI